MSIDHYENFPVASVLCPPALRPAITAIYGFARIADDLADEGDAPAEQRRADLQSYRAELEAIASGAAPAPRWAHVFTPLQPIIEAHALPLGLLRDLLSAFEQDVHQDHYADRQELLSYCRRSADPVGRLLLHLYGVDTPLALQQSDQICTALQLINFWQDLSVDVPRGRIYLPRSDCTHHGVTLAELADGHDSTRMRALVADLAGWARGLMVSGQPLVHTLPGRAGWELRLVVQGGLRILDKIERMQYSTLGRRPVLGWQDGPRLLWRALSMRAPSASALRSTGT
jgi:squalene synthase HpnC